MRHLQYSVLRRVAYEYTCHYHMATMRSRSALIRKLVLRTEYSVAPYDVCSLWRWGGFRSNLCSIAFDLHTALSTVALDATILPHDTPYGRHDRAPSCPMNYCRGRNQGFGPRDEEGRMMGSAWNGMWNMTEGITILDVRVHSWRGKASLYAVQTEAHGIGA